MAKRKPCKQKPKQGWTWMLPTPESAFAPRKITWAVRLDRSNPVKILCPVHVK